MLIKDKTVHERNSLFTRLKRKFLRLLRLTARPHIRMYNGYGNQDHCIIFGHLLSFGPIPRKHFRRNFFTNTFALLRLFMVRPMPGETVIVEWNGKTYSTITAADGFFRFEWKLTQVMPSGWHPVSASWQHRNGKRTASARAEVCIPHNNQYCFISDIDDTFLISHSSQLRKRLFVLLTENARSRKPFSGVAQHYELLARASTSAEKPNPFYYVSSSEWNLHDYIREFCSTYHLPKGVFLLNQIKTFGKIFKTGQNNHDGKFIRIARILEAFPDEKFVLLGDDSQRDPFIYASIVGHFSGKIHAVYLRKVHKKPHPDVNSKVEEMVKAGVHVCYFRHSADAIRHSRQIKLIE